MIIKDIQRRVDELLHLGQAVLATAANDDGSLKTLMLVDRESCSEWQAATLSFLFSLSDHFGASYTFSAEFQKVGFSTLPRDVKRSLGILKAAKQEIDGGWLTSFKEIVSAEIFSDFLEMTAHLLEQGYKDAAAVMTGSILEGHLRQLCLNHDLPITKPGKSERKTMGALNEALAEKEVYNSTRRLSIDAWIKLRNDAAHGDYGRYNLEQIRGMLQGVKEFVTPNA